MGGVPFPVRMPKNGMIHVPQQLQEMLGINVGDRLLIVLIVDALGAEEEIVRLHDPGLIYIPWRIRARLGIEEDDPVLIIFKMIARSEL